MASLDPLARHDFMATVMTAMAGEGEGEVGGGVVGGAFLARPDRA
jgi:hypothetical protein